MQHKNRFRIIAAILTLVFAASMIYGCKLTTDEPENTDEPVSTATADASPIPDDYIIPAETVVMKCNDVDITLYDFGQSYYGSQYFQYMMYGMIDPDQYCDMICDELSSVLYMFNEAKKNGIALTDEELSEIDVLIDEHIEQVLKQYEERVEGDTADKSAEARKLLETDLANDGLDYNKFLKLAKNNIVMSKTVEKYYNSLSDAIEISDEDVIKHIEEKRTTDLEATMLDFMTALSAYNEGNGECPAFIPDDCFSVNHIYMAFETKNTDEGGVEYLTDSRKDDEEKLESLFPETDGFDAFMELEKEYGEDPGMDNEIYVENGYLIHSDLVNSYFHGFVYAAMNLHEGSWETPVDPEATQEPDTTPLPDPELKFFTLKDGTKIVKVYTESAVHYIIVNKEYKKGPVDYEKGDEKWASWRSSLSDAKLTEQFETLTAQWKEDYTIDINKDIIKAKYAPKQEAESTEDAGAESTETAESTESGNE